MDAPVVTPLQVVPEILERARVEGWTDLGFIAPTPRQDTHVQELVASGWKREHVFPLSKDLPAFPTAAASISTLTHFAVMWNPFERYQPLASLGSLTNLRALNLKGCRLSRDSAASLITAFGTLRRLSMLSLGHTMNDRETASSLAEGLYSLDELIALSLSGNPFSNAGIEKLCLAIAREPIAGSITHLELSSIDAELGAQHVAHALGSMTSLTYLNVSYNKFQADGVAVILEAISASPIRHTLRFLGLEKAGALEGALNEIVSGTTDAQAVLAAYERLVTESRAKTLLPLNEVKLLVVGNEAVGKTSLIRFLVDNTPRDPSEKKTSTVAIREKIDARRWSPHDTSVTLNVWDFGGQEIMRGTHKFFLTQGSVYLIVLEDRRQDDRSVYEWLATVKERGGTSPIVIVINKSDGSDHLRLDEAWLTREYSNIVAFIRTSCDDDVRSRESIANLRRLLIETIESDQRLAHIREPRPRAWLRVKSEIVEMAKSSQIVLDDQFRRICEATDRPRVPKNERIPNEDEQRRVLSMLHDLGAVVAHGLTRTAPVSMRQITLLDPNWLTTAIYTILNSPVIRDQGGEFSGGDLDKILDGRDYPRERHEFIIDMMEHPDVGLLFEIPGSSRERHLIPEALPPNSPDYSNWPADSLRFRFDYALLPQRLIPRFIVQSHRNLTSQPTRWRTGVVLQAAGCKVLVRADIEAKQVHIAADGPHGRRRSALNVVLDDLDEVHALNPEVKPKAMVPLPDQPEVAVEYEYLLELEQEEGLDYAFRPAGGAKRKHLVRELLEGTRWESRRQDVTLDQEARRSRAEAFAQASTPATGQSDRSELPLWARSVFGAVAAVIVVAGVLYLPDWRSISLVVAAALGAAAPAGFGLFRWHRLAASGLFTGGGAAQIAFNAAGHLSGPDGTLVGSAGISGPSDVVSIVLIAAGVAVFGVGEYLERRGA